MKKVLLVAIMVIMSNGCSGLTVQERIDNYTTARDKAVNTSHVIKCEKDCMITCNVISNDIDRVDCKASCIDECRD